MINRLRRWFEKLEEWHRHWRSYKPPRHIHVGTERLPGIDYEEPLKQ